MNNSIIQIKCDRSFSDDLPSSWNIYINLGNEKFVLRNVKGPKTTKEHLEYFIFQFIEDYLQIFSQIKKAWTVESCHPSYRDKWSADNPSTGQCYVTAALIQHYYGGKVYRCMVDGGSHYFNKIGNEIIDLTAEQFSYLDNYKDVLQEQYNLATEAEINIVSSSAYDRYLLLLNKVIVDFSAVPVRDLSRLIAPVLAG